MSGAKEKSPYLVQEKKTGRWHFRIRVPEKLKPAFGGKAAVWHNLETTDFDHAIGQRKRLLDHYRREFTRLKRLPVHMLAQEVIRRATPAGGDIADADSAAIGAAIKLVWHLLPAPLQAALNAPARDVPAPVDIETLRAVSGMQGDALRQTAELLEAHRAREAMTGPAAFIRDYVDLRDGTPLLEQATEARIVTEDEDLTPEMIVHAIEAQQEWQAALPAHRAALASHQTTLAQIGLGPNTTTTTAPGVNMRDDPATWTISHLADERQNAGKANAATAQKQRIVSRRLVQFLGRDPLARDVTKLDIHRFMVALEGMPSTEGLPRELAQRGDMPTLLAWAQDNPTHPKIGVGTRRLYLATLRALFAFGMQIDACSVNPALAIEKPKDGRTQSQKRRAQEKEELRAFIDAARAVWGPTDAKTLAALLMIYSGARRMEIAFLRPSDLFEDKGGAGLCIRITPYDERGVKTTDSDRVVPVHSDIADLLRAHKASLPPSATMLFALGGGDTTEKKANALTAQFRKLWRKIGITDKRVAPIHSFRHAFESEAGDTVEHDDASRAITGRRDPDAVRAGYKTRAPSLTVLRRWIECMDPLGERTAPEAK